MMKKNSRKTYLVISLIIAVVFLLAYWLTQSHVVAERRNHIFCDLLHRGESKEVVIKTLEHYGKFDYSESTQGKSITILYMSYIDENIVGNKDIGIVFEDGKYLSVYMMSGFEEKEFFCDN